MHHHIIYRSHGGSDVDWNMITLCVYCHDAIHHPGPKGQGLRIEPDQEGGAINANGEVRFVFTGGWTPRRNT